MQFISNEKRVDWLTKVDKTNISLFYINNVKFDV